MKFSLKENQFPFKNSIIDTVKFEEIHTWDIFSSFVNHENPTNKQDKLSWQESFRPVVIIDYNRKHEKFLCLKLSTKHLDYKNDLNLKDWNKLGSLVAPSKIVIPTENNAKFIELDLKNLHMQFYSHLSELDIELLIEKIETNFPNNTNFWWNSYSSNKTKLPNFYKMY